MNQAEKELYDAYLDFEDKPKDIHPENFCDDCNLDMIEVREESIIACPNCGTFKRTLITVVTYEDTMRCKFKVYRPYKRSSHVDERVKFLLCRRKTKIPNKVLESIKMYIKTLNLTKDEITPKMIRYILKRLDMSNRYRQIYTIHNLITKKKPHHISDVEMDKINQMFEEVEDKYTNLNLDDRKNFLSYNFVLHKLFLKIDRPDIAEQFPLLKGPNKHRWHTLMWRKVKPSITRSQNESISRT